MTFTGAIGTAGSGFADLPAAAGTMAAPPQYACYLLFSIAGTPSWFQVGDPTTGSAICGIGTGANGVLRVVVSGATAGQGFAVVVVY